MVLALWLFCLIFGIQFVRTRPIFYLGIANKTEAVGTIWPRPKYPNAPKKYSLDPCGL